MSNSYSTINQMFFLPSDDSDNILDVLDKYMFTKDHQSTTETQIILTKPITTPPETTIISKPTVIQEPILETKLTPIVEFISPTHQDSLFWCIYIAIHGYNDYQQVSRNYGVKELEIKQKIGNFIQSNPSKMKKTNMKITKVAVQEILSELLTSVRETSFFSMIGMLVFYNINILIVDATGKKMLEFISDIDNELPTHVLHKDKFGKYKLQSESVSKTQINEMKTTIFCLESYLKPLKPISSYHVEDLYKIAMQIGTNNNKKYKKPDLYQELIEALVWK
uniref:Uncharacterized protein n=1 Tax=viral metagenome TaxID=1070528 RepID=A0A6C0DC65_9ZZZZ